MSVVKGRNIRIVQNGNVFRYRVHDVKNGKARVGPEDRPDGNGVWMPVESVDHFESDLNGRVPESVRRLVRRTGHPAIDEVIAGRGTMLGKGDDGVAWRVGPLVVKMSTTVPYQPMNPGHRTPAEAGTMMMKQWRLAQLLRSRGVPSIPETKVFQVADKVFEVKPFYGAVSGRHPGDGSPLSKRHLDQVTTAIGELHRHGYVMGDDIQVGVDRDDNVWFFDLGKLQKGKSCKDNPIWDDFNREVDELKRMYAMNGVPFEPPPGPILETLWKAALRRHAYFVYDNDDLLQFRSLARAAIRAGITNALEDANTMDAYIVKSLARQEEDRSKR